MHAPHTVGACKLESACTGAGLYRRWVPAPEMPRARFLRLRMLDRIKTAHPYEDFITIGPTKSKDILSDPLISKAYCLIYNIMQRCTHAKDHDTYILDIRKNALGLIN